MKKNYPCVVSSNTLEAASFGVDDDGGTTSTSCATEAATAEVMPSDTGFGWGPRTLPFFCFFGFSAAVAVAGPLLPPVLFMRPSAVVEAPALAFGRGGAKAGRQLGGALGFHATVDTAEAAATAGRAGDGRGSAAGGVEKVGGMASSPSMARRSLTGGESSEEAALCGDGSGGRPSRVMFPR